MLTLVALISASSAARGDWSAPDYILTSPIYWDSGDVTPLPLGGVAVGLRTRSWTYPYLNLAIYGPNGKPRLRLRGRDRTDLVVDPVLGIAQVAVAGLDSRECRAWLWDANGELTAGWPVDGVLVSSIALLDHIHAAQVALNPQGGIYVLVPQDSGTSATRGLFLKRFLADGSPAPNWPRHGLRVSYDYFAGQFLACDAHGRAIYHGNPSIDAVVMRYLPSGQQDGSFGVVQPWPRYSDAEGLYVGGSIFVWAEHDTVIEFACLSQSGEVLPGWPRVIVPGSVPVQRQLRWFPDSEGGFYFFSPWGSTTGVHVTSTGELAPGWSGAQAVQGIPSDAQVGSDGAHGFYAAWDAPEDHHAIRYQKFGSDGIPLPGWEQSRSLVLDGMDLGIPDGNAWFTTTLAVGVDRQGGAVLAFKILDPNEYNEPAFAFGLSPDASVDAPPAAHRGSPGLRAINNPAQGQVRLALTLDPDAPSRVAITDVQGRVLRSERFTSGASVREVEWSLGGAAPPGIYFAWLTQGTRTSVARLTLLH